MEHRHCINGQQLKEAYAQALQEAREKEKQVGFSLSVAGKAYFNAVIQIYEKMTVALHRMMQENETGGILDMEKTKLGLVLKVVNLDDLDLRRAPKGLETEMMQAIEALKEPKDSIEIPESYMAPRALAAYLTRLRKKGVIQDERGKPQNAPDIRARKDKNGKVYLVRVA